MEGEHERDVRLVPVCLLLTLLGGEEQPSYLCDFGETCRCDDVDGFGVVPVRGNRLTDKHL